VKRYPGADPATLGAAGITIALWASAFPAIRAGLDDFSPGGLALIRFVVASAAMALWVVRFGIRLPQRRDLGAVAVIGLLGFTAYNLALNQGERTVTAGSAALIVNSVPALTALLAAALLGERLPRRAWLGIAIAFAGVAIITAGEGDGIAANPAALFVVVAALAQASFFVLQKPFLGRYGALELTVWAIWAGTLPLLVFTPTALGELRVAGTEAIIAAAWLGLFPGAIAYSTWAFALARSAASRLTTLLYLVPVLTIGIAYVWLAEVPTAVSLLGGGVAIIGVVIVQGARQREAVAVERRPDVSTSDLKGRCT
jgi:drug/metabolite transporter (DMT)-like permease